MLLQKNIDKNIEEYIANTTGKRYKINFIEPEAIVPNQEKEDSIIKQVLEENAKRAKEAPKKDVAAPEKKEGGFVPPQVGASQGAQNNNQEKPQFRRKKTNANVADEEKLIYKGWRDTPNPKDIKVIDLTPDCSSVILKGKIANYDSRETKNGGFLISFDLYDGTSSINVKAFFHLN